MDTPVPIAKGQLQSAGYRSCKRTLRGGCELGAFRQKKLKYLAETDYYEGTIDPDNGADWNQSAPIDTKPTLQDFKRQ